MARVVVVGNDLNERIGRAVAYNTDIAWMIREDRRYQRERCARVVEGLASGPPFSWTHNTTPAFKEAIASALAEVAAAIREMR